MDTLDNQSFNTTSGGLTPEMDREIAATYPWMRFIAITGFIFMGIFALLMVIGLAFAPLGAQGGIVAVAFIIGLAIAFFPVLFLLQSGNGFKDYISTRSMSALYTAFSKGKAHWRYVGILLIIYLVLVVIGLIFTFTMGSSMMRGF